MMGYALLNSGNYPRSLRASLSGLAIAEDPESGKTLLPEKYYAQMYLFGTRVNVNTQRLNTIMVANYFLGIMYTNVNLHKALAFLSRSLDIAVQTENHGYLALVYSAMGRIYRNLGNNDSAMICAINAYELASQREFTGPRATTLFNLARTYLAQGDTAQAIRITKSAIPASAEESYYRGIVAGTLLLSDLYRSSHRIDSSLFFAREGLVVAKQVNAPDLLQRSFAALASYYRTTRNLDSVIKYIDLVNEISARSFNAKQAQEFQNIEFDETLRQREVMEAEATFRNQLQKYALMTGLLIVAMVAIFLWRISRQRQKSNTILQEQKKEIETAMANLKAAQARLIQSEKMASLGELTAGIAHEIQNPLNFVNNFSEVNAELATELVAAAASKNLDEVQALAKSIKENEIKISNYGKRADGIVKGMLQHSRSSTGQMEPADINLLCDEYVRLAYHGFRAKNKGSGSIPIDIAIETSFDSTLPKISVVPQDIGRVLLNVVNNAFYAVTAKTKSQPGGYEPMVSITTRNMDDKVEIIVRDNGDGIPDSVKEKIFQPFFTTKPAGQGTGLGLSLTYDIVKAHGGELLVESQEGEGFSIKLVLQSIP
jgi:signal transduction histidine kinase